MPRDWPAVLRRQAREPAFALLAAARLLNALLVQTYIHPDETWQSLEVAHRLAFGYGFSTWEWRHGLRGYAHPMAFAAVYRGLRVLGLDDSLLASTFPSIYALQVTALCICALEGTWPRTEPPLAAPYAVVALTAAWIDYSTFRLARRMGGQKAGEWALLCSLASWTMASGVMRPLVNSAETALAAAAFAKWPWRGRTGGNLVTALGLAAAACVIRPTSGVLWALAGAQLLARQRSARAALRICGLALAIGAVAVAAMALLDHLGYGYWTFPTWRFLQFNVGEDLGTWFGESAALYHVYVSLPVLFTTMLPLVLHGVLLARSGSVAGEPSVVAAGAVAAFSLVGHMEYRFLYPLLPIGFAYAGASLARLTAVGRVSAKKAIWALVLTNVPVALYTCIVHQRGVIDVMALLRTGARAGAVNSVGFLMPCHSTPFYSHMHVDIPMWFLSCEPPLVRDAVDTHYWEADDFERDPNGFMAAIFAESDADLKYLAPPTSRRQPRTRPSHLVLYDATARRANETLYELGYREDARLFNSHVSGDARRQGDIVVFCRN
ncbi:glycosylphosphatidylinositol anchor biosynthesis [Coemansia sp. RSA 552]|nr:glycosylphosphatidylinositol anchor biosynthesis [Coemansia sp. RSA 552]